MRSWRGSKTGSGGAVLAATGKCIAEKKWRERKGAGGSVRGETSARIKGREGGVYYKRPRFPSFSQHGSDRASRGEK